MTLVIWTGAKTQDIKKVFAPIVSRQHIRHRIEPDLSAVPHLEDGDVLLACGTSAFERIQPWLGHKKKLSITSLRNKPFPHAPHPTFLTFDPGIVNKDWARLPEMQWDCTLAIRQHNNGHLQPKLGVYKWVESFHELIQRIETQWNKTHKPVPISCDLETKGLDEFDPEAWIISIFFTKELWSAEGMYFTRDERPIEPKDHDRPKNYWEELWLQIHWLCTTEKVAMRGANFKYDSRWLVRKWNVYCTNLKFDTVLAGSLLDENRSNSLKLHAKIYTEMGGYDDELDTHYDKSKMDEVPLPVLLTYAGGDTDATQQSADVIRKELLKDDRLTNFYANLLHPSSRTFEKMERGGMCVDLDHYHDLKAELEVEIARLDKEMIKLLPNKLKAKYSDNLSLTRPALLRDYFFTPLGLNMKPSVFTEKAGDPSTGIDHLLTFADDPVAAEFVGLLRDRGSASKTYSTYVVGFMKHIRSDGRFHPTYLLSRQEFAGDEEDSGAVTGRTSAKEPAVQCLRGDSLVLTDKGWLAIKCIVERVEAGEAFKTLTHTGQWRRIVGTYRNGVKPVFSVASERATLVSTANHPYLTQRGWVRTDELQPGDICYELRAPHQGLHQPDLPFLGSHEESVHQPDQQGLAEVWRSWDQAVREMAHLCPVPGGHGAEAEGGYVHRARGRERTLRAGQLCVGDSTASSVEPDQHQAPHARGQDADRSGLGQGVRDQSWTPALSALDWDADGASLEEGHPVEQRWFQAARVQSIQAAGEAETFDLTIEGSHSFVANGFVVHNTIPKHTKWTKKLRRAFIPPPGKTILQVDFSQGELKICACLAEEPTMLQSYLNGIDLHAVTAAQLNGYTLEDFMKLPEDTRDELRSGGKAGNFGLIYGMQAEGFVSYAWNSYGVKMTQPEGAEKREAFFDLYNRLPVWHDKTKAFARRWGHVRSPLGRVRHLPLINSSNRSTVSDAERQAVNSPVQSCLSDMMQLGMTMVDREYGQSGDIELFLMTHDAAGWYVPIEDAIIWAKRIKAILDNLPLKKMFGWDHQLPFTTDAEICNPDSPDGVLSFAYLKKLKGL